ncbi:hypothetical protein B0O80DRAFT_495588 [Mortierella sp. GBAus27b]|nr:hypothetical protein B0O80DRAFT_495588 [Mortierella sp. GBAus27b]
MEPTQSFRLAGTTDILEIPCDQDDGQNVIFWDTILEVYPETLYVKNGNTLVRKMKDPGSHGDTAECSTIASTLAETGGRTKNTAEAGAIADMNRTEDVQVPTLIADGHVVTKVASSVASASVSGSQEWSVNTEKDSKDVLSLKQVAVLSQIGSLGSASEPSILPDMQTQLSDSSSMQEWIVQGVQNGQVSRLSVQLMGYLRGLKDEVSRNNELALKNNELATKNNELASTNNELATKNNELASSINEMALKLTDLTSSNMESTAMVIKLQEQFNVKQDEMKQLQIQALDQLALLQNRVQALMNQTYELHEYPIPRLFVVLPQNTSSWNPMDFFSNKFRLYFLCECGDHTRRPTSKIPHHIHLAKHEGYEIARPNEFFQQYGNYVLTILKMLKFGVSVVGVAVPAVTLLVRTESLDKATSSLKMLIGNLQTGMEQTIGCLEKSTADNGEPGDRVSHQMGNNEALEGADLRKLGTFLKKKDGSKVLGNLYRTTTSEGHVKWVCIDHYRENYHEKTSKAFRDTVESMGGSFDENIGRVSVHIRSKIQADQFYQAMETAMSVYELDIGLDWDTVYNDFKKLRDCIIKSNVGALHINLHRQDVPPGDILNRGKRHDPILEVMRHPSIHSISIVGAPSGFIRRSSLLSRNDEFPTLRTLEIDLFEFQKEIPGLNTMISKMSHLTKLTMNDSGVKVDHVCGACGTTESFQGSVEVDNDRVKVNIRSRTHAELVYQMLESSKSLHGFAMDLQLNLSGPSTEDSLERTRRHDSIFNIMRHPSTHTVVIRGAPVDFFKRFSLLSTNDNFPNLERLYIEMSGLEQDIPSLKSMVSRMPKISNFTVNESQDRGHHVCVCDAVDPPERTFEVDNGCVKIHLRSRVQAELVHQVLESNTINSVSEIDLRVELKDRSNGDISDRIHGHGSIFNIMRHHSTHSVTIIEPPEDFIQRSSLLSNSHDFLNVRQLNIDLTESKRDIPGLKVLVSRMPNLSVLTVNNSVDKTNHIHGSSGTVDLQPRSFEVEIGRVTICIRSRIELDLVYQAFETIRSVYGLDIDITVDMTDISTGDIPDRIQRHDAILDIMRHPSTHSVTITGAPSDFLQQSSLVSRNDEFFSLKHLDLDLSVGMEQDIPGLKVLVSQMPNLHSLALKDSCFNDGGAGSSKRPFEVDSNRVKIHLWSRIQAEVVSHLLTNLKSISGLGADLCVEMKDDSTGDIADLIRGYDSVFDIMGHPSVDSVTIMELPKDLIEQSSLLSRHDGFFNLKHMVVSSSSMEHVYNVKRLVSQAPNLSNLTLQGHIDNVILLGLYIAIAEYQTYPVTLADKALVIPPLTPTRQVLSTNQYMTHLLRFVNIRIEDLALDGREVEGVAVDALTKLRRGALGLRRLFLSESFEGGDQFIKNVAGVISQHELGLLAVDLMKGEGGVRVLETLERDQWKHIRDLWISVGKDSIGTRVMKALAEGRDKGHGPVELDYFHLSSPAVLPAQIELLRLFVALTGIKRLELYVDMTSSEMVSVLNSMAMYRLEEIELRPIGYSSKEVDGVLDCLTNAHNLREVRLKDFTPTPEQKKRMKDKGVSIDLLR